MVDQKAVPIPYNKEAEEALVGAVIIDPDLIIRIDLNAKEFYIQKHRWLWSAIHALHKRNVKPDFVTLCDELKKTGKLDEMGGPAYITQLVNATPTTLGAEQYADLVHEMHIRRGMLQVASGIAKAAYDPKADIDNAVGDAVVSLTQDTGARTETVKFSQFAGEAYDEISERAKDPKEVWGIATGFIDWDHYTGGQHKGETTYIAGEPGIGKSRLVLQTGMQMADKKQGSHPGAIFSLEMRGSLLAKRALSILSEVPSRALKTGRLEGDHWSKLTGAVDELDKLPIFINDMPGLTLQQLQSELAKLKSREGIEWYVLDYLYLMGGADGMNDIERSTYLSRGITEITKQLNLVGLTVNSVVKEVMDGGRPGNKGLRGSGQLIHDADNVAFLTKHLPGEGEFSNSHYVTLTFTKGRENDSGSAAIQLGSGRTGTPGFTNVTARKADLSLIPTPDNGNGDEEWWMK